MPIDVIVTFVIATFINTVINGGIIVSWKFSDSAILRHSSLELLLSLATVGCWIYWTMADATQYWFSGHDILPCLIFFAAYPVLQAFIAAFVIRTNPL
jgi:hypothetical protein